MKQTGLVILGCGGHARSVADVALAAGFERLVFVDDLAKPGEELWGFPVRTVMPENAPDWVYLPCAGDNHSRETQMVALERSGLLSVSVISPQATIGRGASLGLGTFVGHHAHVAP